MASADVKEIISKLGIDSVIRTREELEKAYLALQDNIVGYKALNDVLAQSKGIIAFNKAQNDVIISEQKIQQSILKTEQAKLKLEQTQQTIANKEAQRAAKKLSDEQKQIAADEAKIARIKRIEETETQRIQKEEALRQQELASLKQITAEQANEATARGRSTQQTNNNTKAKKLSNLEQEKANQLAKIDRLNLVAQAKEGIAVKGSLEQRQLALSRLQKTYSLLNAQERLSPFGQRLAKTIPELNTQVLTLEKSLGKSQRDVGNYGNAFTKAYGSIRQLAYILPGLGIAGVFNIIFEAIGKVVEQLDLFKLKTTDAKIAQENINKALEQGSYADAVKNVSELRLNIDLAKQGFINKSDVLKQYNETIGQTTGQVKNLDEAEKALNKNADAYIQFTLLKAAAQLSLSNAAQETVKAAQQAQEDEERLAKQQSAYRINGDKEGEAVRKILTKDLKRENEQRAKDAKEATDKQLKIAEKFQKQAAEIAKKYNFSGLIDLKKDENKKGVDPAIQARKNAAALIQVQIDAAKEQQTIYKEQSDNQNFSLESRLLAQERFEERSRKIAELEARKSIAEKKVSNEEIKAIESKQQLEEIKITSDGAIKRLNIVKYAADEAERIRIIQAERALFNIEKQRDDELASNEALFNGNLISKEEYEIRKLEITNRYNLLEIKEQISQAEKLIDIDKAAGIDTTEREARLSALRLKYQQILTAGVLTEEEKRLEAAKQNAEKIKEVSEELFNFTRGLTSRLFDNNIQQLEKEKEIRQKNTDLELENIQESTLSEKEKAEQTAKIQAQGEQQQQAIDAKIRDQKRRQAIADKAFAIGQIAINTAVAVSKALAQTGVLGAFVIPGIIAIGAIQAATVLAQPIPKFEKGGTMNKDGLMITGEKGTELRLNPDGSAELTPDKANISFAKAGTKIINNKETMRLLAKPDKYDNGGKSWDISGLIDESRLTRKELKKAIEKQSKYQAIPQSKVMDAKLQNYYKRNGF